VGANPPDETAALRASRELYGKRGSRASQDPLHFKLTIEDWRLGASTPNWGVIGRS